jgi:integrase/recombinase XerD
MMLKSIYPQSFAKYLSLPILGAAADGFTCWLVERGYPRVSIRDRVGMLPHVEAILKRRGIRHLHEIGTADLIACRKNLTRRFALRRSKFRVLEQYLHTLGLVKPAKQEKTGGAAWYLEIYAQYLKSVRGVAPSTIQNHLHIADEFLSHIEIGKHRGQLKTLNVAHIESFVKKSGQRLSRSSLRQSVSRLRGFLRFLATRGEVSLELGAQVDSPRIYRQECLPRTLPWKAVQSLLDSIDRSCPRGLRDFTMLLIVATYGLRTSDVLNLTLDDIDWRVRKLSVSQQKTGTRLELPLTDAVATALVKYLKKVPPSPFFRQIFLRMHAPIQRLSRGALSSALKVWSRRSGLKVTFNGPRCIRHSYAVFLLRNGTSLKTIGDLLGHRSAETTCTYLRLAIEDLRDVTLPVPVEAKVRA